jgi:septum site-determining protein MinD
VKYHLLDVLEETASLEDALVTDKHSDGLRLLAAAQTREKDDVDTEKMRALIQKLRETFDYILIDCPAGIEMGFKNAVAGADEAIVVCTPEVSAVRDVDRVVGLLGNKFKPQLIINRLRPALVKKGKMLSVDDVNSILRLPLLGVIADEPEIIVTTNKGEPLALRKDGLTASAYHAIAARVAGEDVPAPTVDYRESFFDKLGSFFGGRR